MKKLLNTLYVTSENSYLGLDGENIVIYEDDKELGRLPLHNLESIVSFGYRGVSPALMGACSDRNIALCFHMFPSRQSTLFFPRNRNLSATFILLASILLASKVHQSSAAWLFSAPFQHFWTYPVQGDLRFHM